MKPLLRTLLLAGLALPLLLGAGPPGEEVPESRYLPRVGASPPAPATSKSPEGGLEVRWDFRRPVETVYRFLHETTMTGEANGLRSPQAETVTRGRLTLRSPGGGRAELVLHPEEVTVKSEGRTLRTDGPSEPTTVAGVEEDGRIAGARSERQALLALLFPLPPDRLRVGSSSQRPVQLPFALGPVRVTIQGTATTTLVGWVEGPGRPQARLDTVVTLTRVLTPPGTAGSLHAAGRGRSTFYWDPAVRQFTRGTLALRILGRYGYDRPNPLEGFPALRLSAVADTDQVVEIQAQEPPAAEPTPGSGGS